MIQLEVFLKFQFSDSYFLFYLSGFFYVITLSEVCYFASESHYLTQKKELEALLKCLEAGLNNVLI